MEGDDEKAGTANKSDTVEVTAPSDSPSAAPSEVAEGEESPAAKAQLKGSGPSKESSLPSDAPPEAGEGEEPPAVQETPGTADDSNTVEVTAPEESETAAPAEVAEGEQSKKIRPRTYKPYFVPQCKGKDAFISYAACWEYVGQISAVWL